MRGGSSSVTTGLLGLILWMAHALASLLIATSLTSHHLLHRLASWGRKGLLEGKVVGSKRPQHISFLLLERELVWRDLARLVVWSVQAGVSVISLYDAKGRLKERQDLLLQELTEQFKQVEVAPLHLEWRPHHPRDGARAAIVAPGGLGIYPDTNGRGTGKVNGRGGSGGASEGGSGRHVTISLLGPEDGKPDVALAARGLAARVAGGQLAVEAVTADTLAEALATNQGLPDPCLLVRLGQAQSNGGFPPWQLRLTELHSLPSHRGVLPTQLEDLLNRYGSCQQRFGR